MYKLGWEQFVPFATVIGILATDLLKGITIGIIFGIFTPRHSYRNSHHMKDVVTTEEGHEVHHIELAQKFRFLIGSVMQALEAIPVNSKVIIDCSKSKSIAHDVIELIKDYESNAKPRI